jgi:hypothetical protein
VKEYAPRKVFVLENGEYIELTNEEFEHRKATDPSYADKLFLPVWYSDIGLEEGDGRRPEKSVRWTLF